MPLEYVAFTKEDLEGASQRWQSIIAFFEKEERGTARLTYLILPKYQVDSSVAATKNGAVLGVFEELSRGDLPGGGFVRIVTEISLQTIADLKAAYSEAILEDVYGQDIVAWNDSTINQLLRVCWLNKESPFDSAKLRAVRRFTEKFLVGEYRWFLTPEGMGRMVIISGLRGQYPSKVHIFIPSQGTSALTFVVGGPDRAVLRDVIRVMEEEEIPVSVSVAIRAVGIRTDETSLAALAAHLEASLTGSNGNVISGFYQMNVNEKEQSVHFLGFFLRDAVDPRELRIALRPGAPYCLVGRGSSRNGWQHGPAIFTFPPGEPDLRGVPPKFVLQMAPLPSAARLSTTDLWHHSISFGEIRFARDIEEIQRRHGEIAKRKKLEEKSDTLFVDPHRYIRTLGSKTSRKVLGLGARDQRAFAAEAQEINAALEALWGYVQIARSPIQEPVGSTQQSTEVRQEPVEIMIIKHVPAPMRNWRRSLPGDRLCSYVKFFLEFKKNGDREIRIKEVEMPAREAHATRSVDVTLVPRADLERPRQIPLDQ